MRVGRWRWRDRGGGRGGINIERYSSSDGYFSVRTEHHDYHAV